MTKSKNRQRAARGAKRYVGDGRSREHMGETFGSALSALKTRPAANLNKLMKAVRLSKKLTPREREIKESIENKMRDVSPTK